MKKTTKNASPQDELLQANLGMFRPEATEKAKVEQLKRMAERLKKEKR